MPDRLKLTKNAQFFRIGDPTTDDIVNELLEAATENMVVGSNPIIYGFREELYVEAIELRLRYTISVYESNRPVYFLDGDFADIIHAFILVIEIGQYVAVLKLSLIHI